ncbi:MAG: S9 family peptidase, partial [Sphingomonas sp.]|nr:S9 family peptidase [Sphingomonas sp.]
MPLVTPPAAVAAPSPRLAYPATRRLDLTEQHFGTAVADPYRWLENDVRNDAQVRDWVTDQNRVTDAFLATLPLREKFKARMTQLYDYERFGVPVRKGGRYFYTRNNGLQNQAVLFVRET